MRKLYVVQEVEEHWSRHVLRVTSKKKAIAFTKACEKADPKAKFSWRRYQ